MLLTCLCLPLFVQVNLTAPDQTILVQVTRNAVGASVVTRYRELHKFNMRKCADVSRH
jgi:tRNA(Ser,Leu) C12 N-acetylase TAN1